LANRKRVNAQRHGLKSDVDRAEAARKAWMRRPICPTHKRRHADGLVCKTYHRPKSGLAAFFPRGGNFDSSALVNLILDAA
jgi:hypothetical protein